jgi:hypothetical protein
MTLVLTYTSTMLCTCVKSKRAKKEGKTREFFWHTLKKGGERAHSKKQELFIF